jgi:hypothetical protein
MLEQHPERLADHDMILDDQRSWANGTARDLISGLNLGSSGIIHDTLLTGKCSSATATRRWPLNPLDDRGWEFDTIETRTGSGCRFHSTPSV